VTLEGGSVHVLSASVSGIRNLSPTALSFHPQGNLLFGLNGSGKTSFLESLHLLAVGRSFRNASIRPVISHDCDTCLVTAKINKAGKVHHLGMERHRNGESVLRIDAHNVAARSSLAALLPVVMLDTEGLALIFDGPDSRRRYVDGTLFHVEPSFLAGWRRYQRALKQRNAGLKRAIISDDEAWLFDLARAGESLTNSRRNIVARLAEAFQAMASTLSPALAGIELIFKQGWDQQVALQEALTSGQDDDIRRGFTQAGPHRADLRLRMNGRAAAETLSRGQAKLVVAALKLAQGQVLTDDLGFPPVYLVDDITAELDESHAARVCEVLQGQGGQVFIAAVEAEELTRFWLGETHSLFHVEQGRITTLS